MDFMKKRWKSMIAAMILALFSGIGYAWSVFQMPLIELFEWDIKSVSLTFTIQVLTSTILPIFIGRFQNVIGVPNYLRLGILVYAGGLFLTSMTTSIGFFYVSFGLIVGTGIGMLYPCLMAYSAKLFPEKTGFAAGLLAGAYGCGAVLWAPIATLLMNDFTVIKVYAILAAGFVVVMLPVSLFVKKVPDTFQPVAKQNDGKKSAGQPEVRNYTWKEMLRSYKYYILLTAITLGATAGLMITGHASNIMQETLHISPTRAALFVGLISMSNTLGRLILGPLSDRIGRYNTMMIQFGIIGASMFVLTISGGSVFIGALLLISACYGGFTAMISPVCADNFGLKYHAVNYTFLYVAYGLAGVIGPQLAAGIKSFSGGYIYAFLTVAALSALGIALVIALKVGAKEGKRMRKSS